MFVKKSLFWLSLYAIFSILVLIGENAGIRPLVLAGKPLLMPSLALWFFFQTEGSRRYLRSAILSGLGFATAGDIFLMFTGTQEGALFFLLGLGAFLLTHLFYTGGFFLTDTKRGLFLATHPWWTLPFLGFTGFLLTYIWNGIPQGLHGPVSMYALAITFTALSIVNLYPYLPRRTFYVLLTGVVLFILSDSMIAVGRFNGPFAGARPAIMVTYILGQWLIVSGARIPASGVPDSGKTD